MTKSSVFSISGGMRFIYLICVPLLVGCGKLEMMPPEVFDEEVFLEVSDSLSFNYEYLDTVMSNDVLERAYQMATLMWTPVNPIPMTGGGYYPQGKVVTGVPYSSVKEINTYLFQDVSYHTFMTAVHNPKSVLYTKNISQDPYHGKNCAPYYGSVCSSSVMYALGIDTPYYANQMIKLPFMEKLEYQVVDSLKICDVIWKSGHVQMVYNIEHRADSLYRISMFESSGKSAHITKYTREQFIKMWKSGKYVGYRYMNLRYSDEPVEFRELDPIAYNDDLCPSKGDKSVYRTTDTVTVNIFNPTYNKIVLTNVASSAEVFEDIKGEDHQYYDLPPGVYFVHLQGEENRSAEVSFEIVETNVSYSNADSDDQLRIFFHSSAEPVYATLCDNVGGSLFYFRITPDDWDRGYIVVPRSIKSEYYCKIVFKGEYGRIINEPIRVE